MSVREMLNNNPRVATGLTIVMILAVTYLIYTNLAGGPGGAPPPARDMAFFTDDDGNTWFADDAKKIPPFERDGKQAVRARVYRSGGKTYVNHLERYTPAAKKRHESVIARAGGADVMLPETVGLEVKAPGGSTWVNASRPEGAQVMKPRFPGGDLEIVMP